MFVLDNIDQQERSINFWKSTNITTNCTVKNPSKTHKLNKKLKNLKYSNNNSKTNCFNEKVKKSKKTSRNDR